MTKLKFLTVIIIIIIGLIFRLHNYHSYPQRGASSDEYTYSFLGISLLTKGYPESWSNVAVYDNLYHLTIKGIYFPMVYPYFDHPPLNGILVGEWAILNNQTRYPDVDLKTIRLVPIFLSIISSLLLFLLGLKLFNFKTAVWALLIFSSVTTFVMNQRVVFAENLLTPLLLGSLCIYVYAKKLTVRKTIAIGILSGLSFWTKEVGISVFFTMFYLYLYDRQKSKLIFLLTTLFLLFFIGYLFYGYAYDWSQFLKVIQAQSDRKIGPDTLLQLTSIPVIVNKVYFDGWYYFGFLSIFFALFDFKRYKILIVSELTYLILIIFSISKGSQMGWYMIPLFPIMALLSADLLTESLQKTRKSWFIFLLLLFVGFYEIKYLYESNFGLTTFQFMIFLFLLFGPFIVLTFPHKETLFRKIGNIWFYVLILGTMYLTYTYIHPA